MRVVICTMFGENYYRMAAISVPNMEEYASKHGYDTHIIRVNDDDWAFKKHEAFKELFEKGYDVIWYKDVDALITNMSIKVEDFIDDDFSFYLTKDFNELNGGSVIILNTNAGRTFNDIVLENKGVFENEQNFYNSIIMSMFGVDDIMKPIGHPSINSYDYSLYPECAEYRGRPDLGDWEPGHFLIHFPGLSPTDKLAMMNEYKDKIIYE